ncbi:ribonucleoside-diphosphate reductase subunit alpha [Aliarcobacter butzleri]|uniref:Ribonucleoside-diphosphate reductase n=1 Tax=Aliarcobacter butzleri TaxID=28197 RepID=A0AAW6VP21_9BACT|nr:ribonucleoside-diphosphate reductase subunit alpha [Aliarcobacter butzleri]MDK2062768.1 ribonucleoside-diphosphate reductase subunit alpha [Aliarcobacter butzleri]
MVSILIKKRSGEFETLDISKIQVQTSASMNGLNNVSQSELEVDARIQFVDGMSTVDIAKTLIQTAVNKIDIDRPDWTYVAARLFLFDLYHKVGRNLKLKKGSHPYGYLKTYILTGIKEGKLFPTLADDYDLEDLQNYIKPERDYQFNYLGIKTLYDRYLVKNKKGDVIELPQFLFMCVAMFLAQNEENKQERAKEFYDVLSKFEVMVATPTLSNARTNRHQLSSCYIGSSPDNIEGIFDAYKEMALLSKFGGGIGWDWNLIRAQADMIDNTPGASGGTVPFLKIANDLAIAVDQLGVRKGAIAVYIEPSHADVLDFLDLKKNSGEERRRAHDLFPALWIGDDFMKAVQNDEDWNLFARADDKVPVKTIKAKDLWKKVLTSYFETGSPFLCFKDTANRANPNSHVGKIRSSNLCTEIFQNTEPDEYKVKIWFENNTYLLADEDEDIRLENGDTKKANKITSLDTIVFFDGSNTGFKKVYNVEKERVPGRTAVCNLASVNLSKVNTKEDFERVVPIAVRMLDNVIDLNFYPLKKVKDTNLKTRAIGLGVMGEAQMLAEKNIMFGSEQHFDFIDDIMEMFSYNTIKASMKLAKERGVYPDFEGSSWSKGIMPHNKASIDTLNLTNQDRDSMYCWGDLIQEVKENGVRNGYMMAIAPTSSISILVGTTQAIEPVYKRKWFEENLSGLIPVVVPNLSVENYQYYVGAYDVEQTGIIKAAAIRQKWIDQGQSTNVFIKPENASGKYLNDLFMLAWKLGNKSTYYLRSKSPEAKNDVEDRSLECAGCQ